MEVNNITINKQSSIRIEGAKVIYFDPFSIENELHDADIIFVTHDHFDHFDPKSIEHIAKGDTILVAPESMKNKAVKESGIDSERCVFYQPGKSYELEGLQIETVPAYNKIKPFHPKFSKWCGYIVTMEGIRYYVAGDTDATEDMKKVSCDVALVPVGGHYTMDKEQAAAAILTMQPKVAIPTHYGEVVGKAEDGEAFKKFVEANNAEIKVELKL